MLETLKALAEPNRLRIVELLREGPLSVSDLVTRLNVRQPIASKHLRVLMNAGVVESRPEAQWRYYALRPEPLQELNKWLKGFREHWEVQFQGLDDLLEELKADPDPAAQTKRAREKGVCE
jgi:DNA-binding transcriptional ArsR family regulator